MLESNTVVMWEFCKQKSKDLYLQISINDAGAFTVKGPDDKLPFKMFHTVEGLFGFVTGMAEMQDFNAVKRFDNRSALQTVWDRMSEQHKSRTSKENIADVLETLTIIKEGTTEPHA